LSKISVQIQNINNDRAQANINLQSALSERDQAKNDLLQEITKHQALQITFGTLVSDEEECKRKLLECNHKLLESENKLLKLSQNPEVSKRSLDAANESVLQKLEDVKLANQTLIAAREAIATAGQDLVTTKEKIESFSRPQEPSFQSSLQRSLPQKSASQTDSVLYQQATQQQEFQRREDLQKTGRSASAKSASVNDININSFRIQEVEKIKEFLKSLPDDDYTDFTKWVPATVEGKLQLIEYLNTYNEVIKPKIEKINLKQLYTNLENNKDCKFKVKMILGAQFFFEKYFKLRIDQE